MYLDLLFVYVALAATLSINRSSGTVGFPVGAVDQVGNNSVVHNIKIFKDLDLYSNIVGFDSFLESSLRRKVLKYSLNPLTKLGDNYGSILQALDVKLIDKNDSNQVETLHLICKTTAPTTDLRANLDFTKEIYFFLDIIPAIQNLEEIENVPHVERINNSLPQFYGSRLSLNSSATKADSNAMLLLENLKVSNYSNRDRRSRLKRDEVQATLKILAKMHALGISIRRKQPMVFNSKISPHLPVLRSVFLVFQLKNVTDEVHSVFSGNYSEKVLAAIEQQLQPGAEYLLRTVPDDHTPYTTICHRDLWNMNVMFKSDNAGANDAIQAKLLDFQRYRYESFANDLIFFLLGCADLDDLRMNFIPMIEYYHAEFTKTLKHVDFPLDDYTYDKMWSEIKQIAKQHLIRVLTSIKIESKNFESSISIHGSKIMQYLDEQSASDVVLIQWRCIIDLFIENEFI